MLEPILTRIMSTWLSRTLALDPVSKIKLNDLNGKIFLVRCKTPDIGYYIQIENGEVLLHKFIDEDSPSSTSDTLAEKELNDIQSLAPSTTLEGRASKLIKLLQSDEPAAALSDPDIQLRGDMQAFEGFLKLMQQLTPDYEKPLAKIFGDIPAHGIGKLWRNLKHTFAGSSENLSQHTKDYIFNTANISPNQNELTEFQESIFKLRQNTERLEAKIKTKIDAQIKAQESSAKIKPTT